jgi:hypothetical protein
MGFFYLGLFYFREYTNGLKKIQFSNSNFSEIHSENNTSSSNTNDGGVAYIHIINYDSVVMENCTFERCTGANRGGVFFLYGDSTTGYKRPYIYLKGVTFLANSPASEEMGGDFYCPTDTCMEEVEQKIIIDGETCTTSINSIRLGLVSVSPGNNPYPDYIPPCDIPPTCIMEDDETCSDNCVKFEIINYYFFF